MEVSGQLHAPTALPPGKEHPVPHWTEGWVGPRADLDAVAKRKISRTRQESNPECLDSLARSLVAIPTELSRIFLINEKSLKLHPLIARVVLKHTVSNTSEPWNAPSQQLTFQYLY
jgi:hypothetical protein